MQAVAVKTSIMVTHQQVGFHRWPEAPPEVAYLAHPHRHKFLMIVSLAVSHDDRDAEFHTVQTEVRDCFNEVHDFGRRSCETIARELGEHLGKHHRVNWVEVWEDGEHGSRVEWSEVRQ